MTPVLVCNVAWMKRYRGIKKDDQPSGGGSYVWKTGLADECYNFLPHKSHVYGFVQPPGSAIHIERLGAGSDGSRVTGITVAWAARDPTTGGTYVVGWYKNASVYRHQQPAPKGSQRFDPNKKKLYGFYIEADAFDARLLKPDKRVLSVPRRGKGGMGQSNVWYASSFRASRFLQRLHTLLEKGPDALARLRAKRRLSDRSWQPDVEKRVKVERMAEEVAAEWYEEHEYTVSRVQRENFGWDLQAEKQGSPPLQIEVKGLSGDVIAVELTPNEYRQMERKHLTYRLCVVTRADRLRERQLFHLRFFKKEAVLRDQDSRLYDIAEIVGARISSKKHGQGSR